MKVESTRGPDVDHGRRWRRVLTALFGCLLGVAGSIAQAADVELAKEDLACLSCHDKADAKTTLKDGEVLSLRISTQAYVASVHKDSSCADCHSDIDDKTHGKVKSDIASRREYTLSQQEVCKDCHKAKYAQYDDSVHAALVKEGSDKAPLCSNCHNPHTQRPVKEIDPAAVPPCAQCHEAVYKAYAKDVHGQQRKVQGKAAPTCSDCHHAHDVKAPSVGAGVKDACLSCHKDAVSLHQDWLPNAGRHFQAIACVACHVPDAPRRVSLRLYDVAKDQTMAERTGVPQFVHQPDAAGGKDMGLDERALWSLLKDLSQGGAPGKTVLRGRLELSSGLQAHQIADKSRAIKDCNVCHQPGAAPFQSVTLTLVGADGLPVRHGVQKDVLSSLTSMQSVRGFYAIGGTRIKLLDILFVLVLAGAICVPIGHMTIKRLFKGVRERLEAERLASQQTDAATRAAGDDQG